MIYIIQFIYFIPIHKLQIYNFIGEKKSNILVPDGEIILSEY